MKWYQRIFDFYLDASVHVSFAIFALVKITEINFEISIQTHLSWFLFFGSIACYNFIKYGLEAEKYLMVANQYHKNIQVFSLAALTLALYHSWFLNFETWTGIGCLLFLTGLYAIPVLPNAKNLRSWGGLKIFVVALVWSGSTVILPLLSAQQTITRDVSLEIIQRFVFVLVLLIPFEIRDLAYDKPELKTLPQRYGVARTKLLGVLGAVLFFFLTFVKDDISIEELISKGIVFLILVNALFTTRKNQTKYFASFWIESIPVFWWIMAVILGQLFYELV
jgi:hypothetical protein